MNLRRRRVEPVVERRPLRPSPQSSLTLAGLPVPPAMNGIAFGNEGLASRVKRYRSWQSAASWQVRLQEPRRVRGRVAVSITVEETARNDLESLVKAGIDLLCDLNLIDGDHRDGIREVHLRRDAARGMRIEVSPVG